MMLKLQRYQSSVQYKRGKKLYVTDTLARAPVADYPPVTNAKYEYEAFQLEIAEIDFEPNRITSETINKSKKRSSGLLSLCDVEQKGMRDFPGRGRKRRSI